MNEKEEFGVQNKLLIIALPVIFASLLLGISEFEFFKYCMYSLRLKYFEQP